jgi:hypothetical protein
MNKKAADGLTIPAAHNIYLTHTLVLKNENSRV